LIYLGNWLGWENDVFDGLAFWSRAHATVGGDTEDIIIVVYKIAPATW
jgi:hypothetical protein